MRVIVLYGYMSDGGHNKKNQKMIDGILTCGYREFAKNAGCIIYPCIQYRLKESWEYSMPNPDDIVDFCNDHPDAIVWSVKYSPEKNEILSRIKNFKIHYPCNAKNSINSYCDINLVDTEQRMTNASCRLYLKGKDPDFWKPIEEKKFDYLLMGTRDDKNQSYFIRQLNSIKQKRKILWIGGKGKVKKTIRTHHEVSYTSVGGPEFVSKKIGLAKIGILYSEIASEGFPQSFLEMTMSGVPVVYGGPYNPLYFFKENSSRPKKKHLIIEAEDRLKKYNADVSKACRACAVDHYSIEKSIERMCSFR